jgi:hypothetical protein
MLNTEGRIGVTSRTRPFVAWLLVAASLVAGCSRSSRPTAADSGPSVPERDASAASAIPDASTANAVPDASTANAVPDALPADAVVAVAETFPDGGTDSAPAVGPMVPGVPANEMYFLVSVDSSSGLQGPVGGVIRLSSEGRFERVNPDFPGLAGIASSPDGELYVAGAEIRPSGPAPQFVDVLSAGRTRRVPVDPAVGVLVGVVPLAGGRFWTAGFSGVGYWDGEKWSLTSAQSLAGEGGTVEDIAGDATGAIWVLTNQRVFRNEGGGFVEVPCAPLSPRYKEFVRTPDGGIAVRHDQGLLRFVDDAWVPADLGSLEDDGHPSSVLRAEYRADGWLFVVLAEQQTAAWGGRPHRLLAVAPDGTRKELALGAFGVPAMGIGALAVDAAGRLWLSTDAGIAVVAPGLDALARWWPAGSVPELLGRVAGLLALGDGPPLPEAGPVDGRVHGRVVRGTSPVARARVQMCVEPAPADDLGSLGSPCEAPSIDQPFSDSARTRDDGTFDFWEVPAGTYGIAVNPGTGNWRVVSAICCAGMQHGETFDVGSIDLAEAE